LVPDIASSFVLIFTFSAASHALHDDDDDANDYELEQDVVALGLADPPRFLK
jgi:hypothetical protein